MAQKVTTLVRFDVPVAGQDPEAYAAAMAVAEKIVEGIAAAGATVGRKSILVKQVKTRRHVAPREAASQPESPEPVAHLG